MWLIDQKWVCHCTSYVPIAECQPKAKLTISMCNLCILIFDLHGIQASAMLAVSTVKVGMADQSCYISYMLSA